MKKLLLIVILFLSFSACKNDDDNGIDCALFDPVNRTLFIKLVDTSGNNLIENNTFVANDIKIVFNEYTATQVVFNDVDGLENLIALNLVGEAGNNSFEIMLSNNVSDVLILDLKAESKICGWTFLSLNSATYNEKLIAVENFDGNYLITVVK